MAAEPQRRTPSRPELLDVFVPWIAAAVAGFIGVRRLVGVRLWPALVGAGRAGARTTWRATSVTTDGIARAVLGSLSVVAAAVDRVDRVAVPALAGAGRGVVRGVGWWAHAVATGVVVASRGASRALDALEQRVVPVLQDLGAAATRCTRAGALTIARGTTAGALTVVRRTGAGARTAARGTGTGALIAARAVRRHGPRFVLRSAAGGVGALTAVAGLYALSGPALGLAATFVGPDLSSGEDLPALDERSVVYAADGSTLAILHREIDRRVVPLEQVPIHVRQAVLAAEDRRFASHAGYDLEAIGRALRANVRAGGVAQGGSTITQQVAKQTFTDGERTLSRKARELLHAVALERDLGKDEILERYLNQVYFGTGAYGVAAAAEGFFGVLPEDLTVEQSALLAGLIRSPGSLDPRADPERAVARRNQVLDAMAAEGYVTADEAAAAKHADLGLVERSPRTAKEPHVVEAVKRELLNDPALGSTREARTERLLTGGLRIHTSIEPALQDDARAAVAAHTAAGGPTAAVAAVDPRDGAVLALHGGADFGLEQFDLATQGRRQPGSAMKPFVAAAALERGVSPDEPLPGASPLEFETPGGEDWRVRNYDDTDYGSVRLEDAMAASVNTAFAALVLDIGVDEVVALTERLGIDPDRALGTAAQRGPALALGGVAHGVSPLEMASAYGAFAMLGTHVEPRLVARVTEADGTPVELTSGQRTDALSPEVAAEVRGMLETVVTRGTGTAAQVAGWPVAGKTGTTQQGADAWFVGTTPLVSTAVWVGHADTRRPVSGLTGGGAPARIYRDFTRAALADASPEPFAEPDGTRVGERGTDGRGGQLSAAGAAPTAAARAPRARAPAAR